MFFDLLVLVDSQNVQECCNCARIVPQSQHRTPETVESLYSHIDRRFLTLRGRSLDEGQSASVRFNLSVVLVLYSILQTFRYPSAQQPCETQQ